MKDRTQLKTGSVGTGMFTLTEAVASDHYTLTRRKDYAWGPGDFKADQAGLPDKVVIRVVGNESTAANLLISKEVNAATIVGPDRARLQAQKLFTREAGRAAGRAVVQPEGRPARRRRGGAEGAHPGPRSHPARSGAVQRLRQAHDRSGRAGRTVQPEHGRQRPAGPQRGRRQVRAGRGRLDGRGRRRAGQGRTEAEPGHLLPDQHRPGMQAGAELAQKAGRASVPRSRSGRSATPRSATHRRRPGSWSVTLLPLTVNLPTQLVPFLSGPSAPNGANFASINNSAYATNVTPRRPRPGRRVRQVGRRRGVAVPARGRGAVRELGGAGLRAGRDVRAQPERYLAADHPDARVVSRRGPARPVWTGGTPSTFLDLSGGRPVTTISATADPAEPDRRAMGPVRGTADGAAARLAVGAGDRRLPDDPPDPGRPGARGPRARPRHWRWWRPPREVLGLNDPLWRSTCTTSRDLFTGRLGASMTYRAAGVDRSSATGCRPRCSWPCSRSASRSWSSVPLGVLMAVADPRRPPAPAELAFTSPAWCSAPSRSSWSRSGWCTCSACGWAGCRSPAAPAPTRTSCRCSRWRSARRRCWPASSGWRRWPCSQADYIRTARAKRLPAPADLPAATRCPTR